jgi:DNA-binding MarR family transcriptional regulator
MSVQLYWHIHQLAFRLEKRADELLRMNTPIGFAQYKVLAAVGRNTLIKQNVVAELLNQTEASISRQVHILEKKQLLTIGTVMGNRRARELALTELGEETLRSSERIIDEVQSNILQSMSESDRWMLESLVERITQ